MYSAEVGTSRRVKFPLYSLVCSHTLNLILVHLVYRFLPVYCQHIKKTISIEPPRYFKMNNTSR